MDPLSLPEAWASSSPWTHRRVRFPWVPRAWRQHLPAVVQYAACVTEAPATVCQCGFYSIRWGDFPALEEVADGEGEEQERQDRRAEHEGSV